MAEQNVYYTTYAECTLTWVDDDGHRHTVVGKLKDVSMRRDYESWNSLGMQFDRSVAAGPTELTAIMDVEQHQYSEEPVRPKPEPVPEPVPEPTADPDNELARRLRERAAKHKKR